MLYSNTKVHVSSSRFLFYRNVGDDFSSAAVSLEPVWQFMPDYERSGIVQSTDYCADWKKRKTHEVASISNIPRTSPAAVPRISESSAPESITTISDGNYCIILVLCASYSHYISTNIA